MTDRKTIEEEFNKAINRLLRIEEINELPHETEAQLRNKINAAIGSLTKLDLLAGNIKETRKITRANIDKMLVMLSDKILDRNEAKDA